jgi:hypothetical protein
MSRVRPSRSGRTKMKGNLNPHHGVTETQRKVLGNSVYSVVQNRLKVLFLRSLMEGPQRAHAAIPHLILRSESVCHIHAERACWQVAQMPGGGAHQYRRSAEKPSRVARNRPRFGWGFDQD